MMVSIEEEEEDRRDGKSSRCCLANGIQSMQSRTTGLNSVRMI